MMLAEYIKPNPEITLKYEYFDPEKKEVVIDYHTLGCNFSPGAEAGI